MEIIWKAIFCQKEQNSQMLLNKHTNKKYLYSITSFVHNVLSISILGDFKHWIIVLISIKLKRSRSPPPPPPAAALCCGIQIRGYLLSGTHTGLSCPLHHFNQSSSNTPQTLIPVKISDPMRSVVVEQNSFNQSFPSMDGGLRSGRHSRISSLHRCRNFSEQAVVVILACDEPQGLKTSRLDV